MAKKTKQGKARRDKFYRLAKETGYRSRASFKLVQINRKYEFLQKSRVCVDLCAAPGGWAQVAAETMPVSSIILAIDLVPIRPIPRVKTIVADITTDACRQALKKELQTWKADVFLNDGAPNLGKSWVADAFTQAGLTLSAMKLACEFLRKGGYFVTKVFRSRDYFALMWVFKQLFEKVYATKPQASRNESAEIFVVCQGYLAPHKLDPKFVDPRYVFKEAEGEGGIKSLDLLHPEKVKKKAIGYEEGVYTHHKNLKASEFLSSECHASLLSQANEIILDDPALKEHKSTTKEIIECFKDIKVLGKTDIKNVLKWRKAVLKSRMKAEKEEGKAASDKGSDAEAENSEAENEKLDEEMHELNAEQQKDAKRKRRRVMKERTKLRQKMDLKMVHPGDHMDITDDINLFDIKTVKQRAAKQLMDSDSDSESVDLPGEEGEEEVPEPSEEERAEMAALLTRKGKKMSSYDRTETLFYDDEEVGTTMEFEEETGDHMDSGDSGLGLAKSVDGLSGKAKKGKKEGRSVIGGAEESGSEGSDYDEADPELAPFVRPLYKEKASEKAKLWFSKDAFADVMNSDTFAKQIAVSSLPSQSNKDSGKGKSSDDPTATVPSTQQKPAHVYNSDEDDDDEDTDDDDTDSGEDDDTPHSKEGRSGAGSGGAAMTHGKKRQLDAVQLSLGTDMIRSKKARRDIIDDGFNRYAFNDENLPGWFAEDESKHSRRQIPISKEAMKEYQERQKAIDARPIHKVAEAKGRKKKKALKRLEKARKKADAVAEETPEGMTDREKWLQIKTIYKKAGVIGTKKKSITYLVTKKGAGKKVARPAGVKGQFKVVDPRMKKDMRNSNARKSKTKKGRKEVKLSKQQQTKHGQKKR